MTSQTSTEQLSENEGALEQKIPVASEIIAGRTGRTQEVDPASKIIARELVDLEILYFLSLGPKSGYELKKNLMRTFSLNLSYGTLYPHLHALEKEDLIAGSWKVQDENQPLRKRVYGLTPQGTERLGRSITTLSKIALTIQFNTSKVNLNPKTPGEIERTAKITETAKELFTVQGYTAVIGAKLKGASGIEHTTDVAATNGAGKDRVLIKISTENTIADILRTSVMSSDLKATETMIIATGEITEEAIRLAKSCGITLYSCRDEAEVAANLTPDLVAKRSTQKDAPKVVA
jgi:DNA-binding PadR family transcriptional regulator